MHTLTIIADAFEDQIQIENDCLLVNLKMGECRMGCANCALNELCRKLEKEFTGVNYEGQISLANNKFH